MPMHLEVTIKERNQFSKPESKKCQCPRRVAWAVLLRWSSRARLLHERPMTSKRSLRGRREMVEIDHDGAASSVQQQDRMQTALGQHILILMTNLQCGHNRSSHFLSTTRDPARIDMGGCRVSSTLWTRPGPRIDAHKPHNACREQRGHGRRPQCRQRLPEQPTRARACRDGRPTRRLVRARATAIAVG